MIAFAIPSHPIVQACRWRLVSAIEVLDPTRVGPYGKATPTIMWRSFHDHVRTIFLRVPPTIFGFDTFCGCAKPHSSIPTDLSTGPPPFTKRSQGGFFLEASALTLFSFSAGEKKSLQDAAATSPWRRTRMETAPERGQRRRRCRTVLMLGTPTACSQCNFPYGSSC